MKRRSFRGSGACRQVSGSLLFLRLCIYLFILLLSFQVSLFWPTVHSRRSVLVVYKGQLVHSFASRLKKNKIILMRFILTSENKERTGIKKGSNVFRLFRTSQHRFIFQRLDSCNCCNLQESVFVSNVISFCIIAVTMKKWLESCPRFGSVLDAICWRNMTIVRLWLLEKNFFVFFPPQHTGTRN